MGACARRSASVASLTDTFGYRRAPRRTRCLAHALPARTSNPHQASRAGGAVIGVARMTERLAVLAFAALIVGTIIGVAFVVGYGIGKLLL